MQWTKKRNITKVKMAQDCVESLEDFSRFCCRSVAKANMILSIQMINSNIKSKMMNIHPPRFPAGTSYRGNRRMSVVNQNQNQGNHSGQSQKTLTIQSTNQIRTKHMKLTRSAGNRAGASWDFQQAQLCSYFQVARVFKLNMWRSNALITYNLSKFKWKPHEIYEDVIQGFSTGHFQVTSCLSFKMSPRAKFLM